MTTIDQAQKELEQAQKLLDKAAELERMLRDDTTKPEGGKPAASTDTIDITVVLDRSGSMVGIADDVRGGFDQFVADQRKAPGSAKLTLVQFDTTYEFVHRGIPLDEVPPLELVPRGMTALLDAIGRAIGEAMERVRRDRPEQVLFLIATVGAGV